MKTTQVHKTLQTARHTLCGLMRVMRRLRALECGLVCVLLLTMFPVSCIREPELHLPGKGDYEIEIPIVDLELDVLWNYELEYGIYYDWKAEWVYGWDSEDERLFGPIGYTEPSVFHLRRYYTHDTPYESHSSVLAATVDGSYYRGSFNWGYWDILVWSDIDPINDDVQSLNLDESSSLDSVVAFTNQSMRTSRFQAPNYTRAFYQPEQLFSAYDQAIEINKNLDGFVYDSLRNVYVKQLKMKLMPVTYIYLTQVILHHNRNKIIGVDGSADVSAMARNTNVNTGISGSTPITVTYNVRFKPSVMSKDSSEVLAVAGGKLMTFGICNQNGFKIDYLKDVHDNERHFMDVNMQFNNGMDSTFVFDVTDQVRGRWKGGVITIELDMDTIPVPQRSGGSAFDAVVKDYEDGGTYEFPM